MMFSRICRQLLFHLLSVLALSLGAAGQEPSTIRFEVQIRPILANHCWSCHGPADSGREAGLRLDLRDSATGKTQDGHSVILPGHPDKSELIARIESSDDTLLMPPASAKKPLSDEQKRLLREWIREGAEYETHWAFVAPQRPEVPLVSDPAWCRQPIDAFIAKALRDHGLQPAAEASPQTWLRRVTLDLTGLPPTLEELDQFERALQTTPKETVYEAVADRLLTASHYGERMAMLWLDAARYADTNGYNNDETRTMWPWRDWVIQAYASGMPFDQFLTEQLAGDLLPDATISQKVATGFNRNHVLTTEGGIIEEEYHVEYVADRVHTTATVFMAMSLQCARCHDHKYDPVSQREYYQFAAYFNNIPDRVVSYDKARMAEPLVKVPSPEQQAELQRIETRMSEIDTALTDRATAVDAEIDAWEKSLTPEQIASARLPDLRAHFSMDDADGSVLGNSVDSAAPAEIQGATTRAAGRFGRAFRLDGENYAAAGQVGAFEHTDAFSLTAWIHLESRDAATVLSRIDEAHAYRGYDLIMEGGRVATHFVHAWPDHAFKVISKQEVTLNGWHHIVVTYDGSCRAAGVRIYVDGQSQAVDITTDHELTGTLKTDKPFHIGRRQTTAAFRGLIDDVRIFSRALSVEEAATLARGDSLDLLSDILQLDPPRRSDEQRQCLRDYFLRSVDEPTRLLRQEREQLPAQKEAVEKSIPATMVMAEPAEPRPIFVLKRGQYDQRGEQVGPAVPLAFSPAAGDRETPPVVRNRLELAQWLTDPGHPLTARVAVNRLWEMLFGMGIVETSEDFGVQGALPSHPELLDWLATELVQQHWDQRALLKQMVLSATYRQSSDVTSEQLELDPRNRLLSRGSRFRLSAEAVRDSALSVSGLLKRTVGGPSVKPYQPEGLWEDVSVERRESYVPDSGDGLYRRSMYTFWKRTCPPPGMATFDAPDRETCLVRRARTNTPLQALVLLNDPTYVEASRKLAELVLSSGESDTDRIQVAVRRVLSRSPDEHEQSTLLQVLTDSRSYFQEHAAAAADLLSIGQSPKTADVPDPELAAWSSVMGVLLNLDEAITRH